jgi:hypothetical protein
MSSVPGRDFAIEVYRVNGTAVAVRVSHDGQTGLITQAEMADLYGVDVPGVSRHIQAIFDEGELAKEGNLQKMQIGPGTKPTTLYSVDVAISVGYRVNSAAVGGGLT